VSGLQHTFDPGRFEGILSAKLSSYVSAGVLALFVGWIVSSGSITFRAVTQETPEIQRILAPPLSRAAPRLDFQPTLTMEQIESLDFDAFRAERSERRAEIPTLGETPTVPDEREAGTASPAPRPELMVEDAVEPAAVDAPGDAPAPPPGSALMDRDAASEPAGTAGSVTGAGPTLRRGAALLEGPGRGEGRSGSGGNAGSGAGAGAQGSGRDVAAATGDARVIAATPVVSRVPDTPVRGASAGSEKQALIDWVRDHPFPLSAAVAAALEVDALKDDGTAHIAFADTEGRQYRVYLLHRRERDLLRLLIVQGDRVWRLDLPERDLVVAHVQAGRVQRADSGSPGQTGADAPIIEVSLAAVGDIPSEAETAFGLVRGWLAGEREASGPEASDPEASDPEASDREGR